MSDIYSFDDAIREMIKRYRKKYKLSMAEVAESVGISEQTFRNKACKYSEHQFKTDEVDALVKLTEDDAPAKALKRHTGPIRVTRDINKIKDMLIRMNVSQGRVSQVVSEILEDGEITENEAIKSAPILSDADDDNKMLRASIMNAAGVRRVA